MKPETMLYMEINCQLKKTRFHKMSAYFTYFMVTFLLDNETWLLNGALIFNTAGPKQKAWCAYMDSNLLTQCDHLIFMDVINFIYLTVFLSFFLLLPHNILRVSLILGRVSSIAICYIFLNGCSCGRFVLLAGDHVQLYNVCKHGEGDHWAAAQQ